MFIIFRVRSDGSDIGHSIGVVELHNKPIPVSCDVENDAFVSDYACVSKQGLYIVRCSPVSRLDLPVPGFERPLRVPVVLTVIDVTYAITYAILMSTLSASEARANLYRLIDEVTETHTPVRITGKRNDAVLLSAEDWAAIQETIHLLSVPGMRESIREGMALPIEECDAKLEW